MRIERARFASIVIWIILMPGLWKNTPIDTHFDLYVFTLGNKSQMSIENKLLLYKAILKPIWTYGVQLWGTAANSNR